MAEFIDVLDNLHGVTEFKEFFMRLYAARGKKLETLPALLLSMEGGCGATTLFYQFSRLAIYCSTGHNTPFPDYAETTLTKGNERFDNLGDTISFVNDFLEMRSRHAYLMVDISDFLGNRLSDPYFVKFLNKVLAEKRKLTVVFKTPYLTDMKYNELLEFLSNYLFIEGVRIPPLSDKETIKLITENIALDLHIKANQRTETLLIKLLEAKRSKGRFFYYKTANIIYSDILLFREILHMQDKKPSLQSICRKLLGYYSTNNLRDPNEELQSLIGLKEIKQKVEEITANILYMKKREPGKRANIHMLFTGAPGTGKTIVARLVGRIFKENGILPIGDLIEVTRKDLVGEYIGQTAIKTAEVIKTAMGSVLFIDEAYALTNETVDRKDLGYEAISTLISEMENHVGEFAVIMAGYEDELEHLFELNVGLKDRFAYKIGYKSYTKQELFEIFVYQTKDRYNCSEDLLHTVDGFFKGLSDEFINDHSFANARFVRNLTERAVSKSVLRHADAEITTIDGKITIDAEDFNKAVSSRDIVELLNAKSRRKMGFAK